MIHTFVSYNYLCIFTDAQNGRLYLQDSVEGRSKGHTNNREIEVHVLKADEDEEKFIIKITTMNSKEHSETQMNLPPKRKKLDTFYFLDTYVSQKLKKDWLKQQMLHMHSCVPILPNHVTCAARQKTWKCFHSTHTFT